MNNEKINELALQCGAWHQVYDQQRLMINEYFNYEKFAKLVAQRCISEVAMMGVTQYENKDITWATDLIIKNIKDIFDIDKSSVDEQLRNRSTYYGSDV
jgi:hypothetical protein